MGVVVVMAMIVVVVGGGGDGNGGGGGGGNGFTHTSSVANVCRFLWLFVSVSHFVLQALTLGMSSCSTYLLLWVGVLSNFNLSKHFKLSLDFFECAYDHGHPSLCTK